MDVVGEMATVVEVEDALSLELMVWLRNSIMRVKTCRISKLVEDMLQEAKC